jgi:hippurate hydrolase
MQSMWKACTSAALLALRMSQVQGAEIPEPLESDRAAAVQQIIDKAAPSLLAAYKDLHSNPELAFMEVRTANILATHLKSLGFDVQPKGSVST